MATLTLCRAFWGQLWVVIVATSSCPSCNFTLTWLQLWTVAAFLYPTLESCNFSRVQLHRCRNFFNRNFRKLQHFIHTTWAPWRPNLSQILLLLSDQVWPSCYHLLPSRYYQWPACDLSKYIVQLIWIFKRTRTPKNMKHEAGLYQFLVLCITRYQWWRRQRARSTYPLWMILFMTIFSTSGW